jgi:glycosyltransferase involved in cell wall biosynthesis
LLPQSIDSIRNQTESNWELLIVDDGSTDSTLNVATRYAQNDQRIGVVRQTNQGLPGALNTGFRYARSPFLTWTSDDNSYRTNALATLGHALLEKPNVGLVYAAMVTHEAQGPVIWQGPRPKDFWEANKFGAVFLYRRTIAERVGDYDAALTLAEDYDYFLRLSYKAEVCYVEEVLYDYGTHDGSLTATRRVDQVRALERLLKKHRALGQASRYQLSKLAATVAGNYRRTGQLRDAGRMVTEAWCLSPLNYRSYRTAMATLLSISRKWWRR